MTSSNAIIGFILLVVVAILISYNKPSVEEDEIDEEELPVGTVLILNPNQDTIIWVGEEPIFIIHMQQP